MKIIFYFLIAFLYICSSNCDSKIQVFSSGVRFRSIECSADNKTSIIKYCYIKAISRRVATLNLGINFLHAIQKPIYLRMILFYRYGNIFREVIDTKSIEWCSVMDGISNHLFIISTIEQIKALAGDALRRCPYEKDIDIRNLTIDETKAFGLFLDGHYKFSLITHTKGSNMAWGFNLTFQNKSPLKESMG